MGLEGAEENVTNQSRVGLARGAEACLTLK